MARIAPVVVGSEEDETVTGYTIVNLKEIEDQAPKFGHSPELEARFARVPLGLENSGLSYFRLAPTFASPSGTSTFSRRRSTCSWVAAQRSSSTTR